MRLVHPPTRSNRCFTRSLTNAEAEGVAQVADFDDELGEAFLMEEEVCLNIWLARIFIDTLCP